jgi:hypothetical protein
MAKGVEAQLDEIGRAAQARGAGQRGGGSDHPHDANLAYELIDRRVSPHFLPSDARIAIAKCASADF